MSDSYSQKIASESIWLCLTLDLCLMLWYQHAMEQLQWLGRNQHCWNKSSGLWDSRIRFQTVWHRVISSSNSENTWELWRLVKSIKTLGLRQRLHLQVMPLLQTVDLLESWHQHHMQTNGPRSSDSHIRLDKSISYSLLYFHDYAACPSCHTKRSHDLARWMEQLSDPASSALASSLRAFWACYHITIEPYHGR